MATEQLNETLVKLFIQFLAVVLQNGVNGLLLIAQ
jgi:hypothetical protein